MTRTDVHSPKNINPEDYEYVCSFYIGPMPSGTSLDSMTELVGIRSQHARWVELRSKNPNVNGGNWENLRTCDHCGQWFFYGEMYRYIPTGENFHVGHVCADTTMGLTGNAADYKQMQRATKAIRTLLERDANEAEYAMDSRDSYTFLMDNQSEDFYGSLRSAIRKYGHLTATQQCALDNGPANKAAYQQRQAEREARAAAREANKATLVEGKGLRVSGTIISTKTVETQYGTSFKMLVEQADGSRVFGTIPSSMEHSRRNAAGDVESVYVEAGDTVIFTANVSVSDNDRSFGFFSRPRKGELTKAAV